MDTLKTKFLPSKLMGKKSKSKIGKENKKLDLKLKSGLELGNIAPVKKYLKDKPEHIHEFFNWNQYPQEGVTLLMIASAGQVLAPIQYLIDNGADIHQLTQSGKGVLYFAAAFTGNKAPIIEKLIQNGVDVDSMDNNGYSPLIVAVENNNLEVVTCLIERKANVNHTVPDSGKTALHIASQNPGCKMEIIDKLVHGGARVNSTDEIGYTPLLLAVINNNLVAVKCLVTNFADQNITDKDKKTPLDLAIEKNYTPIVGFLTNYRDESIKDEKLKEMGNEVHNTQKEMQQMKEYLDSNMVTIAAELRKSQEMVTKLGQQISFESRRHSISVMPYSRQSECNLIDLDGLSFEGTRLPPKPVSTECLFSEELEVICHINNDKRGKLKDFENDPHKSIGKLEKTLIEINLEVLVNNMKSYLMLAPMVSRGIITIEQKKQLESKTTERDRNDAILTDIIWNGSKGFLCNFVDILKDTNQGHLASMFTRERLLHHRSKICTNEGMYQSDTYLELYGRKRSDF